MKRCLQLAKNGWVKAMPNPSVGAVLVYHNRIIGEGFTDAYGGSHAEVNAINSVKNKELLSKATLYVSLEPCSHYGKTPPCSDLVIASGIKKVVIGMLDPFPQVAGRGIKKLMDAGCEVRVGVLEEACKHSLKRFLSFHEKRRPYIILKWAETENGFIAPNMNENLGKPYWISNKYSRQLVHKWRSEEQAILVGTQTAIIDNPSLTTRLWFGENPVRVVLDGQLRIPTTATLLDGEVKTIVIYDQNTSLSKKKYHPASCENLIFEKADFKAELARQIANLLFQHEIQSVIIEGGTKTLQSFIQANLWDEARVFIGNTSFQKGVKAPEIEGKVISNNRIQEDTLKYYRND